MDTVSIFVWRIAWLAVVPLYLAERRVGVKRGLGNDPLLKSHENSVISHGMSLKTCEVQRCDGVHSEAVAAIFKKTVPTQRLLCCEFLQAAACLLMLILFARARDFISALSEGARGCQETFKHSKTGLNEVPSKSQAAFFWSH